MQNGVETNYFRSPLKIKDLTVHNRICINPMEGSDAGINGAPGELTRRRYLRFAASGAGLIWFEAVAVCAEGKASRNQLFIHKGNVAEFAALVKDIRKVSPSVKIICQLTHSGRFSRPDNIPAPILAMRDPHLDTQYKAHLGFEPVGDGYLDGLPEVFAAAAALARDAGFDGVDIKMCHRYLLCELLAAHTRGGRYGGSFENRSRLPLAIFDEVKKLADGGFVLGSRFGIYDGISYPYGFGVNKADETVPDFTEAVRVLKALAERGLSVVNVTMGTPYYNPYLNKPHRSPAADPLKIIDKLLGGAAHIKAALPGLTVVSTGFSYLKEESGPRGNAMLRDNRADMIGFGRMAFANPDFANQILSGGKPDPAKCCIACNKCSELLRMGVGAGCIIHDKDIYVPIYKNA